MNKLLIGILGCKLEKFNLIEQSSRNTWLKHLTSDQSFLFYYGSNNKEYLYNDNELFCPVVEQPNVLLKTFSFFNYALKNIDFDFLYRPCNGSFFIPKRLQTYIDKFDKNILVYNGYIQTYINIKYASGSAILFSRKSIEIIYDYYLKNGFSNIRNKYPFEDDVAIGGICDELKIELTHALRVDSYFFNLFPNDHHFHIRNNPKYMYELYKQYKDEL